MIHNKEKVSPVGFSPGASTEKEGPGGASPSEALQAQSATEEEGHADLSFEVGTAVRVNAHPVYPAFVGSFGTIRAKLPEHNAYVVEILGS